jgi:hypothetical protein
MKQFKITSEHINQDSTDDCYLAPNDPLHELKIVQYLAGLGSEARLQEYRAQTARHDAEINKGSNISLTASEKARLMKENNIRPGTPEWFRLWFSRPYMTGEKPVGK